MTIAPLAPFRAEPDRTGADDQFAALYRQYQPQLIRYVTHHFGPRDADEITQEALTRALRSLERTRSDAETWAWLVRVARNVAHDIGRARRICEATDDAGVLVDDAPEDALLPEPAALLDERRQLVRRALSTLPPSQRRILVLYEVDELPCPAIARLVGSNESAVRKALQRARSRFAAEFRALGGASFGSVVFWLRALRRRSLKSLPAAAGSTAAIVVAGTVAVTITAAPVRPLSPATASPVVSVEAPEAAVRRPAAATQVRRDSVPAAASRSAKRVTLTGGSGPSTPDTTPAPVAKIPKTPFSGGADPTRLRLAVDVPVVGRVDTGISVEHAPGRGHGPACDLPRVSCE